jgi:hypothetical protein
MQQSVVKLILSHIDAAQHVSGIIMPIFRSFFKLHRRCSTCFGHYYVHHQELFQTAAAAYGFRINAEVDVLPAVVGLLV